MKFRSGKMPKGVSSRLRKLDEKITGSSFIGRFNRYVLNTNWDEDYNYKGNNIIETPVPSKKVKELASELSTDGSLFLKHLPILVVSGGHRLYEFGLRISEMLCAPETVNAVIAAQLSALPLKQTQFTGGFFYGLKKSVIEIWEDSILCLLDDSASRDIGVEIILRSGVSTTIVRKLIGLYEQGRVKSAALSRLAWQVKEDSLPQELIEEVLSVLVNAPDDDALRIAIELTDYYFFNEEQPRSCPESLLFRLLTNKKFFDKKRETMTDYHWHAVARGFRSRFPMRDSELFLAIMSHLKDMSLLRSTNYALKIADEITQAHPDETWAIVSSMLESDEIDHYYLTSWLGEEFEFEGHGRSGAIRYFDPHIVMSWILQDRQNRAWKMIRCLPKTLDENEGGKLTKLFLETLGDDERLGGSLIGHFWTGGWSGPESAYLSRKRDKARQWISETKSGKALAWLYRFIESLTEAIKKAELDEERRFL